MFYALKYDEWNIIKCLICVHEQYTGFHLYMFNKDLHGYKFPR